MKKVLLIANMTLEKRQMEESETQLKELDRVSKKYKNDLAVYAQYSFDVCGGSDFKNIEIEKYLRSKNLLTDGAPLPGQIRFLEKVN